MPGIKTKPGIARSCLWLVSLLSTAVLSNAYNLLFTPINAIFQSGNEFQILPTLVGILLPSAGPWPPCRASRSGRSWEDAREVQPRYQSPLIPLVGGWGSGLYPREVFINQQFFSDFRVFHKFLSAARGRRQNNSIQGTRTDSVEHKGHQFFCAAELFKSSDQNKISIFLALFSESDTFCCVPRSRFYVWSLAQQVTIPPILVSV